MELTPNFSLESTDYIYYVPRFHRKYLKLKVKGVVGEAKGYWNTIVLSLSEASTFQYLWLLRINVR